MRVAHLSRKGDSYLGREYRPADEKMQTIYIIAMSGEVRSKAYEALDLQAGDFDRAKATMADAQEASNKASTPLNRPSRAAPWRGAASSTSCSFTPRPSSDDPHPATELICEPIDLFTSGRAKDMKSEHEHGELPDRRLRTGAEREKSVTASWTLSPLQIWEARTGRTANAAQTRLLTVLSGSTSEFNCLPKSLSRRKNYLRRKPAQKWKARPLDAVEFVDIWRFARAVGNHRGRQEWLS